MVHNTNIKYAELIDAVQSLRTSLEPKLNTLMIDMGQMRDVHNKPKEKVVAQETNISELRPTVSTMQTQALAFQREVEMLQRWPDNVEDR
ncbi:hypothetical protein NDU88_004616 [Pleurodeles waltl]|uniref:Uncharacterized protein n=1 Tax=Pleurodeles waltl TaxID=8319 RepID=A0AAV7WUV1_PLEWA|nr:hypothetical protein NDU88_004616 [Pleurodeles waltl]